MANKKHSCEKGLPYGAYGSAICDCVENSEGELWVGNGEYKSQVNFCPFCGFKARKCAFVSGGDE